MILVSAGVLWAATFSLAKIATDQGAHPIGLAFWQAVGGALIMLVICALRKNWPEKSLRGLIRVLVVALLGTALPGTMYFYAAREIPTGVISLTIALVPILTYAAALCVRTEQYSGLRLAGVGFGFLGVFLLTRPEALPDPQMLPWVGLALLCAVCYTSENMFVELYVPPHVNMEGVLLGGMTISSLLLIPALLISGSFTPFSFPMGATEWSIVAMALINCFSYLAFLFLIQSSGAVFASVMGYVVTLAGVGWGMMLFGEQHSILVWVTLALLLVGMALVRPKDKSHSTVAESIS